MESPTPQRRFGMANAWEPLGEDLEQFGIDHQFLFLGNAAPDLLLQALQWHGGRGIGKLHRGVESVQQGQGADIANKNRSAGCRYTKRSLDHPQQVGHAREILDHRIEYHHIEKPWGQAFEIVRRPLRKRDVCHIHATKAAFDQGQCRRGKICREILLAKRSEAIEKHARAATDFENAARLERRDAFHRAFDPFLHFLFGKRQASVAAVPSGYVECRMAATGIRFPIDLVI